MHGALARDLALMLPSYLGSLIPLSLRPPAPCFNRSPILANLSASTESTEPAHGARGVFHCVSAGQDPSARRCAYLDRPAVTSGGSRRTVSRDMHTEDRMTTSESLTRRPRRREE